MDDERRRGEEVVLPGSAHTVPYEEPRSFVKTLRVFLARIDHGQPRRGPSGSSVRP